MEAKSDVVSIFMTVSDNNHKILLYVSWVEINIWFGGKTNNQGKS